MNNTTIATAIKEVNATILETSKEELVIESLESKINRLNANFTEELYKEIKDVIVENNKASKDIVISAFLTIGKTDMPTMMKNFINNPFYDGEALRPDKKNGGYKLADGKYQINFPCLEDAFITENEGANSLAKSPVYHGMIARFLHNLMTHKASILGDGKATKHTDNGGKFVCTPAFNGEVSKEYRGVDFTTVTICGMKDQLNAIVDCILPEGLEIHIVKADVRALLDASTQEKDMAFKVINEDQMINKIFNSLEIRMNDKAYAITSKAKCHKSV